MFETAIRSGELVDLHLDDLDPLLGSSPSGVARASGGE